MRNEVRGTRYEVRGTRYEVRGMRYEVRGTRYEVESKHAPAPSGRGSFPPHWKWRLGWSGGWRTRGMICAGGNSGSSIYLLAAQSRSLIGDSPVDISATH